MHISSKSQKPDARWMTRRNTLVAAACLVLGATIGMVLAKGSRVPVAAPPAALTAPSPMTSPANFAQITPEGLKHMADKQAEPLLARLKSQPRDPKLLAKLGYLYYVTRNFEEAAAYFQRSVDISDNPTIRTELGRAYYYSGHPDQALAEFERVLTSDPDNVNALFNVGMVKWQSKSDNEGAIAAWKQILEKTPHHPRKAEIEQLIARARERHEQNTP